MANAAPPKIWGVRPRAQEDPQIVQGPWIPSLKTLTGQVLAATVVEVVRSKPEPPSDQFWLNPQWTQLRQFLQV